MRYPATGTLAEPDPGGHPLFPRSIEDTGPDLRRFDLIEIRRKREEDEAGTDVAVV